MKFEKQKSFLKLIWKSGKTDILLSFPFLPLYSFAEVFLALSVAALLKLVFVVENKIQISSFVPGKIKDYIHVDYVLERSELIFIIPIIIIFSSFLKLLSGFISNYLTERAGHKVAHSLREEMLRGYLSSPGNRLDKTNPDFVANQLMQDTTLLQGAISKGTINSIRDFLVLLGLIILMFLISWRVFIIGCCVVLPLLFILKKVTEKLNYYTSGSQRKQVEISTRMMSSHHGVLTINALRSHERELSDFEELNFKNYIFMKKSLFIRTFFQPSMEFFATVILVLVFAWKVNHEGHFQSDTFSSMLILLAFSFRYIKNIAGTLNLFSEIKVVFDRVQQFLDHYSTVEYKKPLPLHNSSQNAVIAKNISYTSEDGTEILKNCSLILPKGKKIAFVGESGAGKTTFLRILAGLISPTQGEVIIVPEFLLSAQTPYIFRGTVKENIVYAQQTLPEHFADDKAKELVLALMLAYSDSGANLFLDKKLGFLGEGLSGGERARLALARTLFASPKLILLDEPTAQLDTQSAKLFWQAIYLWQKKNAEHTVIAVSHALHEIKEFDICYIFEGGEIVKQGKPDEVL
jgi:ABC-type multidrug transport system fused ATPase/permease subunit